MKPHVVVLASPGMGHVIPMLELAKRLVLHHHCDVTFFNITTQFSPTQTHLLHFSDLPHGLTLLDLPPPDVSTVTFDPAKVFSYLCIIVRETLHCSLKATLSEMPKKPQALISDMFCTQALDVCKDLSIPAYILSTTSAIFFAFSLFYPKLDTDYLSGEFLHLPGCKPLRTQDLPFANNEDDEWYSYHLCRIPMADGIFMNTWDDLEPVPVRAIRENPFFQNIPMPPVYSIGPLVKESEPVVGNAEECVAWLDKQPPGSVVFVALGSGGNLSGEQLTELAWGLELSQQRFLWVVRTPTSVSGMNSYFKAGADMNDPKTYLPEGFVERTREVGMVVGSWAPQVLVLQHKSTGAFLSHCGWNSVLESVSNGVPIITWPLYADQMVNATVMAEEVGVAVKPYVELPGKRLIGRKEIEKAVRAALELEQGQQMRGRAQMLKQSALKAVDCGGTSCEALAGVVNQWKTMA